MNEAAPRTFLYRVEPGAGPFLVGAALLIVALFLRGALGLIVALTAGGPLAFALLQWLRRGRVIRLESDGLIVQGSISGRRRTVAYHAIRGIAETRRGGLGLFFHECTDPDVPQQYTPGQSPVALDRLRAEPNPAFPARPRLLVTAPVADVETLLAELRRCCPGDTISAGMLDRLIRRRQWRDRLTALIGLLGTPLYVMIIARALAGIL